MIPRNKPAPAWFCRALLFSVLIASPVAGEEARPPGPGPTASAPAPFREASRPPDPLAGTPKISPETTGVDAEKILARLTKPRTDTPADWTAPVEPLHQCGEPRALTPCVPPPPCHPSFPPQPFDLVGVAGTASCGPIYRGPCEPRAAASDAGPGLHRLHDRLFDCFYKWK